MAGFSQKKARSLLKKKYRWVKFIFPITGLLALIWFLIRVIPKPSRATYPCQRVAFPIASGFVIWLVSLFGSVTIFRKAKMLFKQSKVKLAVLCLAVSLTLGVIALINMPEKAAKATEAAPKIPNQPIGVAKGINPGRVAWIHDPEATDWNGVGDGHWWEDNHTNQDVVDEMMKQGICSLTGQSNIADAWDKLFRYFNQLHGKGDVGYQAGEKITIKTNLVSFIYYSTRIDHDTYDILDWPDYMNTSPEMMKALLRQLVYVVGAGQSDIYIGDPLCYFANEYYNKLYPEFPNVNYLDKEGKNGRYGVHNSSTPIYWSSHPTGFAQDYILQSYVDASYIINMSNMKGHTAGVTLCGKNHFGSFIRYPVQEGYFGWHTDAMYPDIGHYRPMVDMMGHSQIGGKTLIYFVDALYTGVHTRDTSPIHADAPPFNDDWPSSLLVSQDPVAIDSVGFDILWNEPAQADYTHLSHGDDYMHEAAEANNPASGTFYDPDHDGDVTRLGSLGVHEHWNNPVDKQYSRNLDTGDGIELVRQEGDYKRVWVETFDDDFNGTGLDTSKWTQFRGDSTNVVVENGDLRLITQKPGGVWTAGGVYVNVFEQKCGRFEARFKIAGASGLNNAFWMPSSAGNFIIDIAEPHYPNELSMSFLNQASPTWRKDFVTTADANLAEGYHTYGLEWTDTELIYYFDGVEKYRITHYVADDPTQIRFSTFVGEEYGTVTDALIGKSMDIDWVKVYQPAYLWDIDELRFGAVYTDAAQGRVNRVAIYNDTGSDLTFTGNGVEIVGTDAADFSYTIDSLTAIPAGETRVVTITFKPVSVGIKTAQLKIYTDYPGRPTTEIKLTDVGVNLGKIDITGKIIDNHGNGVSGVLVSSSKGKDAVTDSNGDYTISEVDKAVQDLTASKGGYSFIPGEPRELIPHGDSVEGANWLCKPGYLTYLDYLVVVASNWLEDSHYDFGGFDVYDIMPLGDLSGDTKVDFGDFSLIPPPIAPLDYNTPLINPATLSATALDNYTSRDPIYAVNGAGMTGEAHTSGHPASKMWMGANGTLPKWFKVDLGTSYSLEYMKIYNFNWAGYTTRGCKNIQIFYSDSSRDPGNPVDNPSYWISAGDAFDLFEAPGADDYGTTNIVKPAEVDLRGITAQWIAIKINSNLGGGYCGLSELRFYGQ